MTGSGPSASLLWSQAGGICNPVSNETGGAALPNIFQLVYVSLLVWIPDHSWSVACFFHIFLSLIVSSRRDGLQMANEADACC